MKSNRPTYKDMPLSFGRRKFVNDDGSVRFRFTEKTVDRYGDVVVPDGVILDNYKSNPIALWAHGWDMHERIPIGKTVLESMEITTEYIDANIMFDDAGKDDFAKMIADKVRNGFLNAVSIGFNAKEYSEDPIMPGQTGYTFLKWELLEISVVPIPALPSALVTNSFSDYRGKCVQRFGGEITDQIFESEAKLFSGHDFIPPKPDEDVPSNKMKHETFLDEICAVAVRLEHAKMFLNNKEN